MVKCGEVVHLCNGAMVQFEKLRGSSETSCKHCRTSLKSIEDRIFHIV